LQKQFTVNIGTVFEHMRIPLIAQIGTSTPEQHFGHRRCVMESSTALRAICVAGHLNQNRAG